MKQLWCDWRLTVISMTEQLSYENVLSSKAAFILIDWNTLWTLLLQGHFTAQCFSYATTWITSWDPAQLYQILLEHFLTHILLSGDQTIKSTVIFTTSCLVNLILKCTGIHYKNYMLSATSIKLSFYNTIEWTLPTCNAELDENYPSPFSLTSHCNRYYSRAPLKYCCTTLA